MNVFVTKYLLDKKKKTFLFKSCHFVLKCVKEHLQRCVCPCCSGAEHLWYITAGFSVHCCCCCYFNGPWHLNRVQPRSSKAQNPDLSIMESVFDFIKETEEHVAGSPRHWNNLLQVLEKLWADELSRTRAGLNPDLFDFCTSYDAEIILM